MKRQANRISRALLVVAALAVCGTAGKAQQAADDQLVPARQVFDGKMSPRAEVATFEHSETLFPVKIVEHKGTVRALQRSPLHLTSLQFKSGDKEYDLFDYLAYDRVAALLVLKDGQVVLEDYELGTNSDSRWPSFSMAKSVSSTLVGAALQQGLIESLDDPLSRYLPEMKGGAYEGVSIRNVLQMASGVKWDETYTDPNSDRRKLLEAQLANKPGSIIAFMNSRQRSSAAGTIWNYSTGESFLIGALLERVTHKPLAAYLSETLWSPLGMEKDATWWTESPGGMGLSGSGLGATLHDYARFGQFVLQGGEIDGKKIVPEGWFREAGGAHTIGEQKVDYGYFWWPIPAGDSIHEGAFEARGIFGQHLYINPREKLVITVLSARPKPDSASYPVSDVAFFSAVARALHH